MMPHHTDRELQILRDFQVRLFLTHRLSQSLFHKSRSTPSFCQYRTNGCLFSMHFGVKLPEFGENRPDCGCHRLMNQTLRQGITYPSCHGVLSEGTLWFAMMRRLMIQTCAPIGNSERPGKRNFFPLGDNGNWLNGKRGIAQSAAKACTTTKNFMFITSFPNHKAGKTQSQTSR